MITRQDSKKSPSLFKYLEHSLIHFEINLGRKPNIIRIPIWRQHELEKELDDMKILWTPMSPKEAKKYGAENTFYGIPLLYIVGFNHIELQ